MTHALSLYHWYFGTLSTCASTHIKKGIYFVVTTDPKQHRQHRQGSATTRKWKVLVVLTCILSNKNATHTHELLENNRSASMEIAFSDAKWNKKLKYTKKSLWQTMYHVLCLKLFLTPHKGRNTEDVKLRKER